MFSAKITRRIPATPCAKGERGSTSSKRSTPARNNEWNAIDLPPGVCFVSILPPHSSYPSPPLLYRFRSSAAVFHNITESPTSLSTDRDNAAITHASTLDIVCSASPALRSAGVAIYTHADEDNNLCTRPWSKRTTPPHTQRQDRFLSSSPLQLPYNNLRTTTPLTRLSSRAVSSPSRDVQTDAREDDVYPQAKRIQAKPLHTTQSSTYEDADSARTVHKLGPPTRRTEPANTQSPPSGLLATTLLRARTGTAPASPEGNCQFNMLV
ncbi:hypothetical protein BU16DRAFT_586318 [Lophium mytilinum]|uniref:Uncharacterized protein n=1 Tax=Lophium mytilinum TaxID=390894 RepID=A0A6A6Q9V0_9PEZI|nr:hypothetical protein BU16DRAFT_586318 [Lophium mytilinum]